jgi:hypothetical protein
MIGSSTHVHKAHWFLRYSLVLASCVLVLKIPITTGLLALDIVLLLCAADFFGLLNVNGWGGKRRNAVGELLP